MRELYRIDLQGGARLHRRGVVARGDQAAAGGKSFTDFAARYVDGREPYPVGPRSSRSRACGWSPTRSASRASGSARCWTPPAPGGGRQVVPGSAAEEAGVRSRRHPARRWATSPITDSDFGPKFRARFGKEDGSRCRFRCERGGPALTLNGKVRLVPRVESRLEIDAERAGEGDPRCGRASSRTRTRPAAVRPASGRCSDAHRRLQRLTPRRRRVDPAHHVHAQHHPPERGEALAVRIPLAAEVERPAGRPRR